MNRCYRLKDCSLRNRHRTLSLLPFFKCRLYTSYLSSSSSSSWSSYWCYSLVPALTAPTTFLHPILFAAWFVYSYSVRLASFGVSWQELFYRVRESASRPTTDWWVTPAYLYTLETAWSSYIPRQWVSILVASYDTHGLHWGYSCSQPPHTKIFNIKIANLLSDTLKLVLTLQWEVRFRAHTIDNLVCVCNFSVAHSTYVA
jgi:hypothetical protein